MASHLASSVIPGAMWSILKIENSIGSIVNETWRTKKNLNAFYDRLISFFYNILMKILKIFMDRTHMQKSTYISWYDTLYKSKYPKLSYFSKNSNIYGLKRYQLSFHMAFVQKRVSIHTHTHTHTTTRIF